MPDILKDYLPLVIFMAIAPSLFNLAPTPSSLLYTFAIVYGVVTLLTNSPSAPIHPVRDCSHNGLRRGIRGLSDDDTRRNEAQRADVGRRA